MRHSLLRRFVGILTALVTVAPLSLTAIPAHAYGIDLIRVKGFVETEPGCYPHSDDFPVYEQGNYCVIYDAADDTWFQKDPGGIATKIELYDDGSLVAKVEFHPYGEYLWVYDTANDSDTIYVTLESGGHGNWGNLRGPYRPPGTSAVVEYNSIDFSFAEGEKLRIQVYDDSGLTDFLTEMYPVT